LISLIDLLSEPLAPVLTARSARREVVHIVGSRTIVSSDLEGEGKVRKGWRGAVEGEIEEERNEVKRQG